MTRKNGVLLAVIGLGAIFGGGYVGKMDFKLAQLIGMLLGLYGICAIVAIFKK